MGETVGACMQKPPEFCFLSGSCVQLRLQRLPLLEVWRWMSTGSLATHHLVFSSLTK
jgi:hypothetical protein